MWYASNYDIIHFFCKTLFSAFTVSILGGMLLVFVHQSWPYVDTRREY